MGKILLFVSLAVTAVTAVLGFINQGTFKGKVEALAQANQEIQTTKGNLEKTSTELKTTKNDLTTVTAEKEQALAQAQTAQSAADQAKTKATELEAQVSTKEGEISKLTADVAAKEAELAQLKESQPAQSSEPSTDVQAQLQEKETLITKLQEDLNASKEALTQAQKREQDRQALKMRDGLSGRVLAVNQAWNFVVLNLGDKNGVVNNAEMLVKRGSNLIGKVRITSVEPATSIADIIVSSLPQGVSISPGDSVIFQSAQE